jgi:hypothetical protein
MMYFGIFSTVMSVKLDNYFFACNTIKWYYLFVVCRLPVYLKSHLWNGKKNHCQRPLYQIRLITMSITNNPPKIIFTDLCVYGNLVFIIFSSLI